MNQENVKQSNILVNYPNRGKIVKLYHYPNEVILLSSDGDLYHGLINPSKWNQICLNPLRKFKDFVTNGSDILAISREGFLFSFSKQGIQSVGQSTSQASVNSQIHGFGILNTAQPSTQSQNLFSSQDIKAEKLLLGVKLVKIAIGKKHFFAQAQDGKLYGWGIYGLKCYELICSTYDAKLEEADDKDVVSIMCADTYPMALTRNGKIFIPVVLQKCTDTKHFHHDNLQMFGETLRNKKVEQIVIGKQLIFALTESGEIYKWNMHSGFYVNPQSIELNLCQGRILKMWTSDTIEMLVVLDECGYFASLRFTDYGEFLSKSNTSSKSAWDLFSEVGTPLNGCIYDIIKKSEEKLQLKYSWQSNLESVFNVQDDSDISFEVEGKIIYCHQTILMAQCSHLRTMIKNWIDEPTKRVHIKKYSYKAFSSFLKYIYTGRLEIESYEINLELIRLAHEYLEEQLLKYCENEAINGLSAENAHMAYDLATLLNVQELKNACKSYIS